jgi:LysM repeat protein
VSSLRPLITICLLALVGMFLYMKINETEPALPEGVDSWTTGGLEIGAGDLTVSSATSATGAPPVDGTAAPAFIPGAASASTASTAAATADGAPPWTPGASATASAAVPTDAKSNAVTETSPAAPSNEPAMPAVPGTAMQSAAAPADATASTDAPTFVAPPLDSGNAAAVATAAAAAATASAASDGAVTQTAPMPQVTPPASPAPATTDSVAGAAPPADATAAAAPAAPPAEAKPAPTSVFPSVRVAVQGALDRGELAQALLLLSDWYGDPSLTEAETNEVNELLSQLAGSVIYEGPPAHRLEPAYIVQAGDTLEDIAKKYDVPVQLLGKINGLSEPYSVQTGQELKVVRGPFSATLDISERKMTLMLDRRYAGQFAVDLDPTTTIEEGQWKVDQKLLSPAVGGLATPASGPTEDRSLLLANQASTSGQAAIIRGPGSDPIATEPAGRVIRLKSTDVVDVYDILSVGSRITIRR